MYSKSATVVRAPGDNSCLHHSKSYILNREDHYNNIYEVNNGFTLRQQVNDYVRENHARVIWVSPEFAQTFISDYPVRM